MVILGAYLSYTIVSPSGSIPSNSSSTSFTSPNCQTSCALWTRSNVSNPEALAISQDDSLVAASNNQTLQVFNLQGTRLWGYKTDHTLSSISISSNDQYIAVGGWQTAPGFAAAYSNGAVYLFNARSGKLLWSLNTGSNSPVWTVKLSGNGSFMAVETETSLLYLNSRGTLLWNYTVTGNTGNNTSAGNFFGMDMSSDGSFIVVSVGYIPTAQSPNYMWAFVALNNAGHVLWSYSEADGEEPGAVALSTDASSVWASSAYSGWNGSIYFFDRQGELLWQRQIYSPALGIQIGGNLRALLTTNWGALLYGGDGSLLENITSSAVNISTLGNCQALPNYWYWSGGEAPVVFLDAQGNAVSSYNPNGYTNDALLSSDDHYALITSTNGNNSSVPGNSLMLVFLPNGNSPECPHP